MKALLVMNNNVIHSNETAGIGGRGGGGGGGGQVPPLLKVLYMYIHVYSDISLEIKRSWHQ